jgi:CubicO group peptidase (beta-lactamase class C family)
VGRGRDGLAGELEAGRSVLALALAPGGPPPEAARPPKPLPANWQIPSDEAIEGLLAARNAPRKGQGIVVGVLDPAGRRVVAGGPDGGEPFDGDTVFEIGSISKVFTALLLADMVNKGEVALDDPAEKYLPAGARMPGRGGRKITLRDLSTHMSALPRLPDNMPFGDPADPYADYTEALMLEFLARYELPRDIGAQAEYSNFGVGLLGYLLGRAAGKDYETLLRERITGPLGMTDTAVTLSAGQQARFAPAFDTYMQPAKPWRIPALVGAGGIRSTADDMLRFASAALDPQSPIGPAMATALATRVDSGNPRAQQALGWQVVHPEPGREVIEHGGGTGGYRAHLALEPSTGRAVVTLANSAAEPSTTDIALHLLLGYPVAPTPPVPPPPPPVPVEVTLPAAELDRVVGRYDFGDGVNVITREGGQLAVEPRRSADPADLSRSAAAVLLQGDRRAISLHHRRGGQRGRRGVHHARHGAHREEGRTLSRYPRAHAREHHLGDLDRVERGALAQVVADHEQREAVRDRAVLAHAADEHRVGAGGVERIGNGGHDHAGRVCQQRQRLRGLERALELEVERQRVAGEHRHAHAGPRHRQPGQAEDLAALVAQLELFLGVVVLAEHVVERDDVEADRHRPLARACRGRPHRPCAPALRSRPRRRRTCSCNSSTPAMPPPETAW